MKYNNVKYLIIHHTGGTKDNPLEDTSHHTFEIVNTWHRQDPNIWLGFYSSLGYSIGYHYFIDKTGKVTQGRVDSDEGAHCRGYNTQSLGICLAGNFDVTLPTKEQVSSLKKLLNDKRKEYLIPRENIIPHRKLASKTCYGRHLDDSWASDLTIEQVKPPDEKVYMCIAENKEIKELKERLSWLDRVLNVIFGRP